MPRISHQEIHEIESCLTRITPGLWQLVPNRLIESESHQPIAQVHRMIDADFILAARRAVPLLIQEVRILESELQQERQRSLMDRLFERLQFWKKEE